jgi:hypothetical protein
VYVYVYIYILVNYFPNYCCTTSEILKSCDQKQLHKIQSIWCMKHNILKNKIGNTLAKRSLYLWHKIHTTHPSTFSKMAASFRLFSPSPEVPAVPSLGILSPSKDVVASDDSRDLCSVNMCDNWYISLSRSGLLSWRKIQLFIDHNHGMYNSILFYTTNEKTKKLSK